MREHLILKNSGLFHKNVGGVPYFIEVKSSITARALSPSTKQQSDAEAYKAGEISIAPAGCNDIIDPEVLVFCDN